MNELKKSKFFCLFIVLGGIFLDQLTKYLVSHLMTLRQSIPLIPGVIHLTYITNDGAAFGILDDQRWIFLLLSTVAILFLTGYLAVTRNTNRLFLLSLSLILSGGIGNMIDRVFLGEVIDFIDFTLIRFAIFNGADSFVCVGAFLLFFCILFDSSKKENKGENTQGADSASALPPEDDSREAGSDSGEANEAEAPLPGGSGEAQPPEDGHAVPGH